MRVGGMMAEKGGRRGGERRIKACSGGWQRWIRFISRWEALAFPAFDDLLGYNVVTHDLLLPTRRLATTLYLVHNHAHVRPSVQNVSCTCAFLLQQGSNSYTLFRTFKMTHLINENPQDLCTWRNQRRETKNSVGQKIARHKSWSMQISRFINYQLNSTGFMSSYGTWFKLVLNVPNENMSISLRKPGVQ